jgi:large subunit ribosomal protein L10
MINLETKQQMLAELNEKFSKAQGLYFMDFSSMNVEEINSLRKKFREKGVEYKVAKNTLIWRAIKEQGMGDLDEAFLKGNTSIALAFDDPLVPAKILKQIHDKEDKPKFKAAIVEKVFYDSSKLKLLGTLPSKAELISGIMGSLESPVSGIVGTFNSLFRDIASLVEEVAKKQNNVQ